jgi:hypothetical protein
VVARERCSDVKDFGDVAMADARMVDLDVFVFAHAESVLSSMLKNMCWVLTYIMLCLWARTVTTEANEHALDAFDSHISSTVKDG